MTLSVYCSNPKPFRVSKALNLKDGAYSKNVLYVKKEIGNIYGMTAISTPLNTPQQQSNTYDGEAGVFLIPLSQEDNTVTNALILRANTYEHFFAVTSKGELWEVYSVYGQIFAHKLTLGPKRQFGDPAIDAGVMDRNSAPTSEAQPWIQDNVFKYYRTSSGIRLQNVSGAQVYMYYALPSEQISEGRFLKQFGDESRTVIDPPTEMHMAILHQMERHPMIYLYTSCGGR